MGTLGLASIPRTPISRVRIPVSIPCLEIPRDAAGAGRAQGSVTHLGDFPVPPLLFEASFGAPVWGGVPLSASLQLVVWMLGGVVAHLQERAVQIQTNPVHQIRVA